MVASCGIGTGTRTKKENSWLVFASKANKLCELYIDLHCALAL